MKINKTFLCKKCNQVVKTSSVVLQELKLCWDCVQTQKIERRFRKNDISRN